MSPVSGEDEPAGHDLQSIGRPIWSEYVPVGQSVQLVASVASTNPCLPNGHLSQAVNSVNGLKLGFAMN